MTIVQKQLLSLLRAALWEKKPDASDFKNVSWKDIIHLADIETVRELLLDGISLIPRELMPDEDTVMDLAGRQNKIIQHNQVHRETIVQIDKALKVNGITAVFMKGQITALRYPHPLHRQPGDIDFVVGKVDFQKTLDTLDTIGKVDRKLIHEHHGMAWVNGVTVEPHYKVHNYQRPSTDKAMQEMFSEVFPDKLIKADLDGYKVNVFPPTFESVFLISHMVNHVYEEGLGLRQVIDYAMFLNKCADRIDWLQHDEYLYRMRMQRAFRIFACICVEYLGLPLPSHVQPFSFKEKEWAKKMMADIMTVGNFGRGQYVFHHNGWQDALRNYRWVLGRCLHLGFVCPSEARWWVVSKFTRFFRKLKNSNLK
jgi:hypothetical protein